MRISGVYIITNLVNFKVYIGSSENISQRVIQHRSDLKGNRHKNKHLQSAYNTYGVDNFTFEYLELVALSHVEVRETFWINAYCAIDPAHGYNHIPTGHRATNLKYLTKGQIEKRANTLRHSIANSGKRKFRLIDPDGKLVEGRYLQEFANQHSLGTGLISSLLNGRITQYKGWRKYDEQLIDIPFNKSEHWRNNSKSQQKQITLISPSGEIVIIAGIRKFCKEHHLQRAKIKDLANGTRTKAYNGWQVVDTKPTKA